MDHKARILQMLEEGKITAQEAFQLIEALDEKESGTEQTGEDTAKGKREKTKSQSKSRSVEDIFSDITSDFQKLFSSEKVSSTIKNIRENEQAKQVFETVEKRY